MICLDSVALSSFSILTPHHHTHQIYKSGSMQLSSHHSGEEGRHKLYILVPAIKHFMQVSIVPNMQLLVHYWSVNKNLAPTPPILACLEGWEQLKTIFFLRCPHLPRHFENEFHFLTKWWHFENKNLSWQLDNEFSLSKCHHFVKFVNLHHIKCHLPNWAAELQ